MNIEHLSAKQKAILNNFQTALIALAVKSDVQIVSQQPGCFPCDLLEDYELASKIFIQEFQGKFSHTEKNILTKLQEVIQNTLPKYECFDNAILATEWWENLRTLAQKCLKIFGWKIKNLSSYQEIENGIWWKKTS